MGELRFIAEKRDEKIKRYMEVARALAARKTTLVFSGLDSDVPEEVKTNYYLIRSLSEEGMKVVIGEGPEGENVYLVPSLSGDEEVATLRLSPKYLKLEEGMDPKLGELIILSKTRKPVKKSESILTHVVPPKSSK